MCAGLIGFQNGVKGQAATTEVLCSLSHSITCRGRGDVIDMFWMVSQGEQVADFAFQFKSVLRYKLPQKRECQTI